VADLAFLIASQTVAQGAPLHVTLRGDFDAAVLGAATFELEVPATGFANVAITVGGLPVPPPASAGLPYWLEFAQASGSPGPIDFAAIDCVMGGLRSGVYVMRARMTDAVDVDGAPLGLLSAELAVTVEPGAVAIVTSSLAAAFAGVDYLQALWAQGGQRPYVWSAAALPAGLTLDAAGVLSGTPISPTSIVVTVTATDQAGASASVDLPLVVHHPPLAITTSELAAAAPGRSYHQVLTATGGKLPVQWEIDDLPAGLLVSGSVVSGTPVEDRSLFGLVPLTLRATDADQPPQTATQTVTLPFVPSLVVQELNLATPGAVVVGRDLCLIEYDVNATGYSRHLEVASDLSAELDRARDELIGSIAELAAETLEEANPLIRHQHQESLVGQLDAYRDLDALGKKGTGLAFDVSVSVDDQFVRAFHFGGQRTIHEWRAGAGRPLLPYREPKSKRARLIRGAFTRGGRRLRAWSRGVLDAAFDDYSPRSTRRSRRMALGDSGESAIVDSFLHLLPTLEDLGYDIGRWFRDLFPTAGRVSLTPGNHRIGVRWDGGRPIHLLGGIVVSLGSQSDTVGFTVTFEPVTHHDWPRFSTPTTVQGHGLGIPGSKRFDVQLSSSGLDIVASTSDGLKLFVDTGKEHQPYASAESYPVQPAITPIEISAAVLDPYGRSSLLLHSAASAALIVNDGPAGLKVLGAGHIGHAGERACAVARGAKDPSGWRAVHVSLGRRMLSFHGLHGLMDSLPDPEVTQLVSSIRLDNATCLSLVEADESVPALLAAGFDADGRVKAVGQSVTFVPPHPFNQPAHMILGEWSGGGIELAVALRQAKEVRLLRWATGAWTPLPPISLPLRPWTLSAGPSSVPCLAVASPRFGAVLLIVWNAPDHPPKVMPLYRGGADVRIGGADGTLAVADPSNAKILVYR